MPATAVPATAMPAAAAVPPHHAAAAAEAAMAMEAAEPTAHCDHLVRRGLIGPIEQDGVGLQHGSGSSSRLCDKKGGCSGCGRQENRSYELEHLIQFLNTTPCCKYR
jgi:hypothetical protein